MQADVLVAPAVVVVARHLAQSVIRDTAAEVLQWPCTQSASCMQVRSEALLAAVVLAKLRPQIAANQACAWLCCAGFNAPSCCRR